MALREVEIHYRFSGGIETKSDSKAVPATKLLALENGVFSRAISVKKRNGYESIDTTIDGSASVLTNPIRLATRNSEELLAFTASRGYSLQSGTEQWSDTGAVYSAVGSDRPLVKTGTQQTSPDHATLSGVTAEAWEDSRGGVWWSVEDATTGRVFRAPTQADASGTMPRCVPVGGNLHIYYAVRSQSRIMVLVVNPAAPSTALTPTILVDDLDLTNGVYDACPTGRTGTPAAIAWFEHGTTAIRIGYVDSSGVIGSLITGHPSALTYAAARVATSPIAVTFHDVDGGDGDRFGLVVDNGFVTSSTFAGGSVASVLLIRNLDSVAGPAGVSVQRVTAAFVAGTGTLTLVSAWEEAAAAASNRFVTVLYWETVSDTTSAPSTLLRSVGLAARAFVIGSEAFVTVVHDTTSFNTYLTVRITSVPADGYIFVGRHVPATAAGAPTHKHLPSAHVATDVVSMALPVRDRLISENDDKFTETGVRLVSMDFDSDASHQAVQLGAGLYMGGACPMHYDGRAWTEQGFNVGPELIVTVAAAGGSMTFSTIYEYRSWYEWTDTQGEVHQGPTSLGQLVTMGPADTQVTLTLPTLRLTQKTNVRLMVARSLAAKTGKTAQLFRVTSLDPSTAGAANGYVANDPTVNTVTFIDRMSDTTLATFDEIYTDGGILSNDPAPLGSTITCSKSRLFTTDPSNGTLIRFSQVIGEGFGVEFPPDFALDVDPRGGDITAIAERDGFVFAFKRGAIFAFSGDGPGANGDTASGGFSRPQLLPGDVGCTEPASIVLTPVGHMFKSAKGIHLLNLSGQVEYVGAPVEAYNDQAVRRATVLPDRTAVVFLTDSGLTLLYDYFFGQWSTFTNHEGPDAAVVGNAYHYLRNDGRVFRETIGQFSDDGQRIKLRFETAQIHPQEQLQGFARFFELFLLGTRVSAHQLGVQYRTDYTNQWNDLYWLDATGASSSTGWITGTNAATIGVDPITGTNFGDGNFGDGDFGGEPPDVYQWRLDLYEPGEAIQFAFEDFEASGSTGASFELTEMLITGGVERNAPKPWPAARAA